jgi:hypothetical protein
MRVYIAPSLDNLSASDRKHLVEMAKNYAEDEFDRFLAEVGWMDWMADYMDGEYITENEAQMVDEVLKLAWDKAHKNTENIPG